eukprot:RCo038351
MQSPGLELCEPGEAKGPLLCMPPQMPVLSFFFAHPSPASTPTLLFIYISGDSLLSAVRVDRIRSQSSIQLNLAFCHLIDAFFVYPFGTKESGEVFIRRFHGSCFSEVLPERGKDGGGDGGRQKGFRSLGGGGRLLVASFGFAFMLLTHVVPFFTARLVCCRGSLCARAARKERIIC